MVKAPIKLKKLLEVLEKAYKKYDGDSCQEHIEVEFWLDDKWLDLVRIGQFGVKPDVTITLSEPKEEEPPWVEEEE